MFPELLSSTFGQQLPNPELILVRNLKLAHPGSQTISVCQSAETDFPLYDYLQSLQVPTDVNEDETHRRAYYEHRLLACQMSTVASVFRFEYNSVKYTAYTATWESPNQCDPYYLCHMVFDSPTDAPGKDLVKLVFQWARIPKEQTWIYEDAHWRKSKSLYQSICSSHWEDIVLKDGLSEGIRGDVGSFFSNREVYGSLNITWKRGILLLGPPGNGKTESIKALLNEFRHIETLYVKSFTTQHGPEHGVRQIFSFAREHSPCILVIEDLDSMVVSKVRSFFLNELDGLAKNEGILTIATTNHPEKIDDAILNRPSRFDVKYNYALPEHDIRKVFALKWINKVQNLGKKSGIIFDDVESTATLIADKTETWSFAFLKELFVSFTLRIAHDKATGRVIDDSNKARYDNVLLEQVDKLAGQIIKSMKDTDEDKGKKNYID